MLIRIFCLVISSIIFLQGCTVGGAIEHFAHLQPPAATCTGRSTKCGSTSSPNNSSEAMTSCWAKCSRAWTMKIKWSAPASDQRWIVSRNCCGLPKHKPQPLHQKLSHVSPMRSTLSLKKAPPWSLMPQTQQHIYEQQYVSDCSLQVHFCYD